MMMMNRFKVGVLFQAVTGALLRFSRAAVEGMELVMLRAVLRAQIAMRTALGRIALADETGGLVEYILVIILIAIAAIVFLKIFTGHVGSAFNSSGGCVQNPTAAGC